MTDPKEPALPRFVFAPGRDGRLRWMTEHAELNGPSDA